MWKALLKWIGEALLRAAVEQGAEAIQHNREARAAADHSRQTSASETGKP